LYHLIRERIVLKYQNIIIASIALFTWAGAGFAQSISPPLPMHRVNLTARAHVQVAQDLLTLSLTTLREGTDPQAVQAQLKSALDAALVLAKKEARPPLMEVRTGRFGLAPRYNRDGKISGWQGSAELVLEGQDFVRISETAGKLSTLTVANASFGLTQTQRDGAQAQAQDQAIALFRQRATDIAKRFGFGSYTLGEVTINDDDGVPFFQPKMMAARAVASDAAPVPVEAGLASVSVTVSGSIQLQ
jgi:predicted secreted protein